MAEPRVELFLARYAEAAWSEAVRPWLEKERGKLTRSYVVVPTRGQAQGLKQRCMMEGIGLLGVEFLSPGLARKKWLALGVGGEMQPAIGRELLLLGLRAIVERRLGAVATDEPQWGLLKSLQSDLEGALDDFDELLKSGFGADDFEVGLVRSVFAELEFWTSELGYAFAPRQSRQAALAVAADEKNAGISGRLLVYGLSAEMWGEFFNVAAFVRCFEDVTVILPEPEFRGNKALDEAWVETWETALGANALPIDAPEVFQTCESVAAAWQGANAGGNAADAAGRTKLVVGRSRTDEVELVAGEIAALVSAGAENIGVVFPCSDAAHLRLAQSLGKRGIEFSNMLETAAPPPVEVDLQRKLLAFYGRGARLDEFLEVWPLLRTLGLTSQPMAMARDVCERLFDEGQAHELAAHMDRLKAGERPEWRETARIAGLLLPAWPSELTMGEALARFASLCETFELQAAAGWGALKAFAEKETRVLPRSVVLAALEAFLPDRSPVANGPGRGQFARVTLTTRRRAEGIVWSHLILVEANAGVWPERREPGIWLTDHQRRSLSERAGRATGLFTGDERAVLQKNGYAALARDTREQVIFSAALFDEEEPELPLAPNSWLERLLWRHTVTGRETGGVDLEQTMRTLAIGTKRATGSGGVDVERWLEIWRARRDPRLPFDDFFFSVDPSRVRPDQLPVRLIERGIQDPAELWFEAVLGISQTDWRPLVRAPRKALGQLVHRVLAAALRTVDAGDRFTAMPSPEEAGRRLDIEVMQLRAQWPANRYWESFAAELGGVARALLNQVFSLETTGRYVAVEKPLPRGASVPLDIAGTRLAVRGRVDLALADRPEWGGARVDIVDFKTGGDAKLSAAAMARTGASLQLGVYLAAVESLGVVNGRVWMLKPETAGASSMGMDELPLALAKLGQLRAHLETGRYGALTAKTTEYSKAGYGWPLACAPVAEAVLQEKFAVTFGENPENAGGAADE